MSAPENLPFEFLDYHFDRKSYRAIFRYRGGNAQKSFIFTKISSFSDRARNSAIFFKEKATLLDRALFLSFIINGTSYYKAFPSREIKFSDKIKQSLSAEQAEFFNAVYQDGLSQFAYENHLTRADLAHFEAETTRPNSSSENTHSSSSEPKLTMTQLSSATTNSPDTNNQHTQPIYPDQNLCLSFPSTAKIIALQSGGKDSLLTATLLNRSHQKWSAFYASTSGAYPKILDELHADGIDIIGRDIDLPTLKSAEQFGALNGHVPVTYINLSLALIQAILADKNTILASIGREGEEPHSIIRSTSPDEPDLAVNHQWSKTATAENLFQNYVRDYVSPDFLIYSPLRHFSELKIAELFAKLCWKDFGHKFSSCNVINYGQHTDNSTLRWCGRCAKCANSYLLFAPFIEPAELDSLFPDQESTSTNRKSSSLDQEATSINRKSSSLDREVNLANQKSLFEVPELLDDFKGLLGIGDNLKPFECVGEIAELRCAYHLKKPGYPDLPFTIPASDFNFAPEN